LALIVSRDKLDTDRFNVVRKMKDRSAARGPMHQMLPIMVRKVLPGINIQEVRCYLVKDWRDRRYAWFSG
jgi:hypothetical protein